MTVLKSVSLPLGATKLGTFTALADCYAHAAMGETGLIRYDVAGCAKNMIHVLQLRAESYNNEFRGICTNIHVSRKLSIAWTFPSKLSVATLIPGSWLGMGEWIPMIVP